MNIVRVDIVDNDTSLADRLQDTFYLVDPDEAKLQELKTLVENRFETGDIEDYSDVVDFIERNFYTTDIETVEIRW